MIRRTPRHIPTDTLFPYADLFRARAVPRDQLRGNRHLVAAVARIRRAGQRHVRVLPAGLHVRLPHGVGEDHPRPARCAHPPLQPCDVEATTEGVSMSIRSEEHTSELQSLMRNSYAVFCLKKK